MEEHVPTQTVTVSIDREPQAVYDFITDPTHFPEWVPSFAKSVDRDGSGWIVQTTDGRLATLEFVPRNPELVADHVVHIEGEPAVTNPLRVIPRGHQAVVAFTLVRDENQDDATFSELAGVIRGDLERLRSSLEG